MKTENEIKKLLGDFQDQGINNYTFNNDEDVVLLISGLRALQKYDEAIEVYNKYESVLKKSDTYLVALTNMLKICEDSSNKQLLVKYAKELKLIASDHPYVIAISKDHDLN